MEQLAAPHVDLFWFVIYLFVSCPACTNAPVLPVLWRDWCAPAQLSGQLYPQGFFLIPMTTSKKYIYTEKKKKRLHELGAGVSYAKKDTALQQRSKVPR